MAKITKEKSNTEKFKKLKLDFNNGYDEIACLALRERNGFIKAVLLYCTMYSYEKPSQKELSKYRQLHIKKLKEQMLLIYQECNPFPAIMVFKELYFYHIESYSHEHFMNLFISNLKFSGKGRNQCIIEEKIIKLENMLELQNNESHFKISDTTKNFKRPMLTAA